MAPQMEALPQPEESNSKASLSKDMPFSLLRDHEVTDELLHDILNQCSVSRDQIEDIYPCTGTQESLVALSVRHPSSYVARYVYKLHEDTVSAQFQAAVHTVVQAHAILRTRVIQTPTHGTLQVVTKDTEQMTRTCDLQTYIKQDEQTPMTPGSPFLRCALVEDGPPGERRELFVVTLHHALYDDWSLNQILHEVEEAYAGQVIPARLFAQFTAYANEHGLSSASGEFWSTSLRGAQPCRFPPLAEHSYVPAGRATLVEKVGGLLASIRSETRQTAAVELAWASVLTNYVHSRDITFGVTFTGRHAPFPEIASMSGPTITTVPRRIRLGSTEKIQDTLDRLEAEECQMRPFEQRGLYHISKLGGDAAAACQFTNLLVIQAPPQHEYGLMVDVTGEQKAMANHATFGTYALTWVCDLQRDGVRLQAVYDEHVLPERQVRRLLHQFIHALKVIATEPPGEAVQLLSGICPEDMAELRDLNGSVPERASTSIHSLIMRQCVTRPDAVAVSAWDGIFRYEEVDMLATRVARVLVRIGVAPETFVPLLFYKSKWTTVAVLAVIKAGAAFILLDPSVPLHRMQTICRQAGAKAILASCELADTAAKLVSSVIPLGEDCPVLNEVDCDVSSSSVPVTACMHWPLYAVFTSGSTGTPKGVVIEHGAFATSIVAYLQKVPMGHDVRAMQFASYSFDVSISDILVTLVAGACLCVPSETERKGGLAQAIQKYTVNWADLTPSLLRRFQHSQMPSLRTVILGGEPLSPTELQAWKPHVRLLNIYGPAECCVLSTVCEVKDEATDPRDIGVGIGALCWVVDPDDHHRLMPVGAVGELLIEGPIVGRGYLNDPQRTIAAFVEPPFWLREFRASLLQEVPHRIYKTGDLVQYTSEKTLRYIARKDKQVKLRGQRIELEEVEYHVEHAFPGVDQAVATLAECADGEKLVVFVRVSNHDHVHGCRDSIILSPRGSWKEALDQAYRELRRLVPEYMVPSIIFPVGKIPTTLSEKIDRRRLQEVAAALSRDQLQSYRPGSLAPKRPVSSNTGMQLQKLYADVLHLSPMEIGADDGFFDLGGDSITAMTLAGAAKSQGVFLSISDLFQNTGLEALAQRISSGPTLQDEHGTSTDWMAEAALRPDLEGLPMVGDRCQAASQRQAVTLTGATGFLGGEILGQLVSNPHIRQIHCLAVRNPSSPCLVPSDKVVVHPGDLTLPSFGLTPEALDRVIGDSMAIIHCAADVSFAKDYRMLRATNIAPLRAVARLAVRHAVPLHFISTAALAHLAGPEAMTESSIAAYQPSPAYDGVGSGYLACKWVCEMVLERLSAQYGLPVVIHRPSSIVGPRAPATDLTNAILQWSRKMRCVPDLRDCAGFVDLIRVETAAQDVVDAVIQTPSSSGTVTYLHETGETLFPAAQLQDYTEKEVGARVRQVTLREWVQEARPHGLPDLLVRFLEAQSSSQLDIALPLVQSRRSR